jgi:hypothetical protein
MTAKTLGEVRDRLASKGIAEEFSREFSKIYFAQALGSLPKNEIDLLVFTLLINLKVLSPDSSVFSIARALNITPTKARGLFFQYQLRHLDPAQTEKMIAGALAKAQFSVDEKRISFGIESPLIRAVIDNKLKEHGIFADISLSGEILRVPLVQFDQFIGLVMGQEKSKELEKALKADGYLKKSSLNAFLSKYGSAVVKEGASELGKQGISKIFSALSEFISDGDASAMGNLMGDQP